MGVSSTVVQTPLLGRPETRLRGRWLNIARVSTIAVALASIALFCLMFPAIVAFLETPCADGNCPLTPAQAQTLGALGLTTGNYALFNMVILFIEGVPALLVAVIIFWRRSDDWLALLVALQLANPTDSIVGATGIWQTPEAVLHDFFLVAFYLTFTLFPSGRFVPRWASWFVVAWAVFIFGQLFVSQVDLPGWVVGPLYLIFYANLLFCQIYRYWRASSPVERQQTKWVVLGLVVALVANIAYWQPAAFIPALSQPDSLYSPVVYPIYQLITISIPLSFGVAILRYRLWDIDTIINKALVYGSLTALLGALYVGLIIGLTNLAGILTDTDSQPVALVISTLVIAALFQPVRHRIQSFIDRRFYRKKYDAEKTLAAFSKALRNEVDLEQVRQQFLSIVQETMQPTQVSLWLRQSEREQRPLP